MTQQTDARENASTDSTEYADQDSPWKEIIEQFFRLFLAFFFPVIHDDIDWSKKYEFLDKELAEITFDSEIGERHADKLVKVFIKKGKSSVEQWLLIHVEVQGYYDKNFSQRMYIYNHRIYERYNRDVTSVAILTDNRRNFRPNRFVRGRVNWGCINDFQFPSVKLLDFQDQWEKLEADPNPFAVVVMAQLRFLQLRKKQRAMLNSKIQLVKMLYARGYNRQEVIRLFRFIDWLIRLPRELEDTFWTEVKKEREVTMPYITSVERAAIERGLAQGLAQGREEGREEGSAHFAVRMLKSRFGSLSPEIEQAVSRLSFAQLEALSDVIFNFKDITDFTDWLSKQEIKTL